MSLPRAQVAFVTMMTAASASWAQRCPEPKIPVVIHWTGGAVTPTPRAPTVRCVNLAEFLAMRRARNAWQCTPPTRTRPAQCTAINVPTAQRRP
jgi:hypothetical protein